MSDPKIPFALEELEIVRAAVRLGDWLLSHGTLTVRITEAPKVVQPEPFSRGQTAVEPFTAIEATRPDARGGG